MMQHLTIIGALLLALCIVNKNTDFFTLIITIFLAGLLLEVRAPIRRASPIMRIGFRAAISLLIVLLYVITLGPFASLLWLNILAALLATNLLLLLPEQ